MDWFKLADSIGLIRQEKFGSKSSCFLHKLEVHQKKWAVLMAWRLMNIISKRDTHKKCWSSHILLIRCLCRPYSKTHLFSQSQENMFPFFPVHQLNWQGHFKKMLFGYITQKFNLTCHVRFLYSLIIWLYIIGLPTLYYFCKSFISATY